MKKYIIDVLACPLCLSSSLKPAIYTQSENEIIEGILKCSHCGEEYPIKEKIPRMIPSDSLESNDFAIEKKDIIKKHQQVRNANITYHDIAADTYDEDEAVSVYQNKFNQDRIEKIIKDLSQRDGNDNSFFLDIGCGTGNILKFGEKYFQHAVGIDVSINMLKLANKRGMEVIQADSLFLPFKPNTFDAVSIFSVLHHIYDYSSIFVQIGRVLKKGGFLYSDWDPQKTPEMEDKFSLRLCCFIFSALKKLKLHRNISDTEISKIEQVDFRKDHPEIKELYNLAEYHEKSEKRGLDPSLIQTKLFKAGFRNVSIKGHWQGKSFKELKLDLLQRLEFKLKSKLSKNIIDRFMENLMIIAQK